ncbi:hypothetical protein BY996DRAFT_6737809 [Phakopsora pachyrhizi]|uniref:Expressed protein n=1 Tax=Phakopsora pachyrhizi TaxID=170000 RepID=A0AAV0AJ11_PHAPC|nr:hypothetical protein BY996DRAFT_6737809 [Phakopsora pachyrhizi]CAH7668462.1 expressed protein [Phakopsora pachyrhizi]
MVSSSTSSRAKATASTSSQTAKDCQGHISSGIPPLDAFRPSNPEAFLSHTSSADDLSITKNSDSTLMADPTDQAVLQSPSSSNFLFNNPISNFISAVSFFSPNMPNNEPSKTSASGKYIQSTNLQDGSISLMSNVTKYDSSTSSPTFTLVNEKLPPQVQPLPSSDFSEDSSQAPLTIGRLLSRLPGLSIDLGLTQLLSSTNAPGKADAAINSDCALVDSPLSGSAHETSSHFLKKNNELECQSLKYQTPLTEAADPLRALSLTTTPQPALRISQNFRQSTTPNYESITETNSSTSPLKDQPANPTASSVLSCKKNVFSRSLVTSPEINTGSSGKNKKTAFLSKLRWSNSTPKPQRTTKGNSSSCNSTPQTFSQNSISSLQSSTRSRRPPSCLLTYSTSTSCSDSSSLGSVSGDRYIKVKKHQKSQERQFNELFLAQELSTKAIVEIQLNLGHSKSDGEDDEDDESVEEEKINRLDSSVRSSWSLGKRASGYSKLKASNKQLKSNKTSESDLSVARIHSSVKNGKLSQAKSAIWALEFSMQASYLAAAGEDGTINVWKLRGTKSPIDPLDQRASSSRSGSLTSTSSKSSVAAISKDIYHQNLCHTPIFNPIVHKRFSDHQAGVLSICWSKNDFLLSASKDRTVRLWHVDREDCLGVFEHSDLVTSVMFHPNDDRYFISGGIDRKLRLWNIMERKVVGSRDLSECITSLSFSIDGRTVLCGLLSGEVTSLDCETLKLKRKNESFSMEPRNGRKVTSVKEIGKKVFMVSKNDSRIMIKSQDEDVVELSGHLNNESQIRAGIREGFDGQSQFVISGSEDRGIHLWSIKNQLKDDGSESFEQIKKSKVGHESFYPAGLEKNSITTCAILAPVEIEDRLNELGDDLMKEVLLRQDEGTRKPSEGLIIVSADDRTGKIRIYRNGGLF